MYNLIWNKELKISAMHFNTLKAFIDAVNSGKANVETEGFRMCYTASTHKYGKVLLTPEGNVAPPDMFCIYRLKNKFGLVGYFPDGKCYAISEAKTLRDAKLAANEFLESIEAKYSSFM